MLYSVRSQWGNGESLFAKFLIQLWFAEFELENNSCDGTHSLRLPASGKLFWNPEML